MIRLEKLHKRYGPKIILAQASYQFPRGERIALVGPNGAGKTTLLNIICGLEESDGGEVVKPSGLSMGYLPQIPNPDPASTVLEECLSGGGDLQRLKADLDAALKKMTDDYSDASHASFERLEVKFSQAGGYAMESRAKGILSGLGFDATMQSAAPKSLSGGWRMRLELAKIFLNDPDFLVLDEPTNHLDLPSLAWVERYLAQFEGTLLFVSHDKDLLNRLPTVTAFLHGGALEAYKGNFDAFLSQREARLEQQAAEAEGLRKRREHLEKFVERFGAKASKARQAQSRMKMISRIQEMEESFSDEETQAALSFRLPLAAPSGREVCSAEKITIGYSPEKPLSRDLSLRVFRGQKIAVIGANGIGKSTLLKTIAGRLPALAGVVTQGLKVEPAYFSQDQLDTLDEDRSVLQNLMSSSSSISEKEARGLLGSFLFRGDDVFKPVRVLSGGEKSRVGLARILVQNANFLLLDEPTNHLDMTSCEILAGAIDDYEGTALFVSHDRSFIDGVCTHVFAMLPDGRSALFEGKLADYERLAAISGFPNVLDPKVEVESKRAGAREQMSGAKGGTSGASGASNAGNISGAASGSNKDARRERQRAERAIEKAEKNMGDLTAALEALEKELLSCAPADYRRQQELAEKQKALRASLTAAEEEWLGAQDALGSV